MRKITCEICGIKTCRVGDNKRVFMAKFPLDEERCKQWVKATGKEDLVYVPIEKLHQLKYLCEKHFRSKDFKKKKTQLKKTAIPCLEISSTPLSDDTLVGFPLHCIDSNQPLPARRTDNVQLSYSELSSVIQKEHNYHHGFLCEPKPLTSTSQTDIILDTDCSTAKPSTSNIDGPGTVNLKRRSWSPVPSTSTSDPYLTSPKRRRFCSPTPLVSPRKHQDIQAVQITPRKRKLIKKLKSSRILIKNLKQKVDKMENIKSPVLKCLIESSIANQSRKPKGKRWTKLNKTVALAIYKKSPKAYRYLSQLLPMPSIRTLQTVLENMKIDTGIDPMSMNHLKKKTESLSDKDKTCVILFDEIALKKRLIYNVATDKIDGYEDLGGEKRSKKIADHALVIMLQGVHKSMKQPIAHYFVKGTIATEKLAIIIKDAIRAVSEAGYEVIATVCDQGPTNMGALNLLKTWGNSAEPHYFFVDNKKVFIIYDVPHLFKSIRNNFMQGGELVMNNKKGKWAHLIKLEEKNSSTLHFKKITKLHVEPKFRAKMRVKLAAQILSNTVAAILKLQAESVENQRERQEILQTAHIVEELDQLFDCTNGPASRSDIKRNIRQNVSKNSFHHRRWIEFKSKIKTLHFLKSDSQLRLRNIRCVNGYLITLSSLQDIWSYLNSVKNFKYMNLRQFNQDALENLFGQIRQHCPTNRNPTCHHFTCALKSAILTRLSAPPSRGSNCEKDNNEIIIDFQEIVFPKKIYQPEKMTESAAGDDCVHIEIDNLQDVPILHIVENEQQNYLADIEKKFKKFEKQPTVYVSGYLASVLLNGVDCLYCIDAMKVSNPQPNTIYNYIALREWWTDKTSLTYPSLQLCQAIDDATRTFDEKVKPYIFSLNICSYAKTEILANVDMSWMCEDHKNVMVEKLLQRVSLLLIRNHCNMTNRSFALSEEASADTLKKAQQQGVAK